MPGYDRSKLTAGIVHIGLGNFHRAHMAVYLDDLFAMGKSLDWAILGAGVREGDAISPFYDSMIGKLIVHGETRAEAVERLAAGSYDLVVASLTRKQRDELASTRA